MLFSNVNGTGLDDKQFWPIYEAANDRDAVMMIHPDVSRSAWKRCASTG